MRASAARIGVVFQVQSRLESIIAICLVFELPRGQQNNTSCTAGCTQSVFMNVLSEAPVYADSHTPRNGIIMFG